eukprot:m.168058 g.168058  ORF g.168058 m.168058 type:complete len:366 (-) comp21146_c1_seq5:24-1121(-)
MATYASLEVYRRETLRRIVAQRLKQEPLQRASTLTAEFRRHLQACADPKAAWIMFKQIVQDLTFTAHTPNNQRFLCLKRHLWPEPPNDDEFAVLLQTLDDRDDVPKLPADQQDDVEQELAIPPECIDDPETSPLCAVCYYRPRNTRLECGHEVLCADCADTMKKMKEKCPYCRKKIDTYFISREFGKFGSYRPGEEAGSSTTDDCVIIKTKPAQRPAQRVAVAPSFAPSRDSGQGDPTHETFEEVLARGNTHHHQGMQPPRSPRVAQRQAATSVQPVAESNYVNNGVQGSVENFAFPVPQRAPPQYQEPPNCYQRFIGDRFFPDAKPGLGECATLAFAVVCCPVFCCWFCFGDGCFLEHMLEPGD